MAIIFVKYEMVHMGLLTTISSRKNKRLRVSDKTSSEIEWKSFRGLNRKVVSC